MPADSFFPCLFFLLALDCLALEMAFLGSAYGARAGRSHCFNAVGVGPGILASEAGLSASSQCGMMFVFGLLILLRSSWTFRPAV